MCNWPFILTVSPWGWRLDAGTNRKQTPWKSARSGFSKNGPWRVRREARQTTKNKKSWERRGLRRIFQYIPCNESYTWHIQIKRPRLRVRCIYTIRFIRDVLMERSEQFYSTRSRPVNIIIIKTFSNRLWIPLFRSALSLLFFCVLENPFYMKLLPPKMQRKTSKKLEFWSFCRP